MKMNKYLFGVLCTLLLASCGADDNSANVVTGEGYPNPNPVIENEWGNLPAGRQWGSTAGIDIDPTDGHVVGYERCGAGALGGSGVSCDTNLVDPVFKFDRHTGEVLALSLIHI